MRRKRILMGIGMALLGFGGGLAGAALFAATQGRLRASVAPGVRDEITARKLVLIDDSGVKRAELSTEYKGFEDTTYLTLMNHSGKPLLNLEVDWAGATGAARGACALAVRRRLSRRPTSGSSPQDDLVAVALAAAMLSKGSRDLRVASTNPYPRGPGDDSWRDCKFGRFAV